MPIEVHCPHPDCARVHLVKTKYAGMRGKCPACTSWMFVPPTGPAPSLVGHYPPSLPEPRAANRAPEAPHALASLELGLRALREQPDEPAADEAAVVTARKSFSRLAAALLLLGVASLVAVAATPFLDVGKVVATEDFTADFGAQPLEGINKEQQRYVVGVPAGVAGLALLSLTVGFLRGRFGPGSLFLVYLAALFSAGLLFIVLAAFHNEITVKQQFDNAVAERQAAGARGEALYPLGMAWWAGLGGSIGATLSFLLAALVLHRRCWSRMLGFLVLGGVASLGVVWVYRTELGIG